MKYDVKSFFSISFESDNVITNTQEYYVLRLIFRGESEFEIRFEILWRLQCVTVKNRHKKPENWGFYVITSSLFAKNTQKYNYLIVKGAIDLPFKYHDYPRTRSYCILMQSCNFGLK